ncbi:MAG: type III-B CRISPR-associated protein Cas10/Cmr2, partial [Candidatus Brockarchaeota archaeon]|nr:type III-B CRISPR-associated protein Cas10/Cmr2 [Candidatus Brockarchaeota archaeon]
VCGVLPAVLKLPYEQEDYEKKVPEAFRVYFDQGESLCGYCLIKRLASIPGVFKKLAEDVFLCIGTPRPVSFPSTGDVASIELKEKIVNVAKKLDERGCENLLRVLETYIPTLPKLIPVSMHHKLAHIRDSVNKDIEEERLRQYLELLLTLQSEQMFLRYEREPQAYKRQMDFLRNLREIAKSIGEPLPIRIYYSILRADADSMGGLLVGRLINALFPGVDVKEAEKRYIEVFRRVLTNEGVIPNKKLHKLYSYAMSVAEGAPLSVNEYDEVVKIIESEGIPEAQERLQAFTNLFKKSIEEFIVTPTYHAAISRALMISAVKDIELIKEAGGVVIYAGGDDFLSLLPVKNTLDAVISTRKHFSEGDSSELGFYELGGGIFPALGLASRSYAVVFGHYLFPMSSLFDESVRALEEAKEIIVAEPRRIKKDVATFTFVPRSGGVKSEGILSLRPGDGLGRAFLIDCVRYAIEKVDSNKFSESLYYDLSGLLSEGDLAHYIQERKILEAILRRIVARNASQELHAEERAHEIDKMIERFHAGLHWKFDVRGKVYHAIEGIILTLLAYHSAVGERE